MTNPEKWCPECGETKPLNDFSPRSPTKPNSYCRQCTNKRAKEKYWSNPEWRERFKASHKKREREKRADPVRNAVMLARLREKRATNPEWRAKTLAAVNVRRRDFPGRNLSITARKRAKVKGLPCTLTAAWVQSLWDANPCCTYCSRPLRVASGKSADDSATLDRIVCAKGYTPENTVLACWRCNTLKHTATADELERLAANIRRVQGEPLRSPLLRLQP